MFNIVHNIRPLLRFSRGTGWRFNSVAASTCSGNENETTSSFRLRPTSGCIHLEPVIPSSRFCISPHAISLLNAPLLPHRREIIEPLTSLRISEEPPPTPLGPGEITLPQVQDIEIVDPNINIIEKRAARLIVIRRRKMKKHKWRKLQKKMKFVYARRRQRKELKKEKAFQAVLVAKVKEAEKFEVETFIARQLETARWERPLTHLRNRRAPDWVIRDHLREKEEIERINTRIEECLRFKK